MGRRFAFTGLLSEPKITTGLLIQSFEEVGPFFNLKAKIRMNEDRSGRLWQFTTGGNCCKLGQRFPAIYQEYNYGLHFTCGINNNGNHYANFQGKANTWYTLEVSQTKNQDGKVTLN